MNNSASSSSFRRAGVSRREFIRATALAAAAAPVLSACRSPRPRRGPANGKLQHACIGVGGMMGMGDLEQFRAHPRLEIVALCDVDAQFLEQAGAVVPGARRYRDWRELLTQEAGRVDSVNVTVPDHMHFPIAWNALRRGMHVYCQKPMCHDVAEVRRLTEEAQRRGVVTQLGTQVASEVGDRTAVQWLRAGLVGQVTHVYLCANRSNIEKYRVAGPRPAGAATPPASLDWDLWLGTAPARPYVAETYHPATWRSWQDFGTGWSGDIGCHLFDAVWKGLELDPARTVRARVQESWKHSPARRADTWPQSNHITWTFPGNARMAGEGLTIEWFDGEFYPPEDIRRLYSEDLKEYPEEAAMVVGTQGALLLPHRYPPQLLPEKKFEGVTPPALARRNHYHHFVDACLGGAPTASHFAQTGPMTEAILLGTVAVRVPEESLTWDHGSLRITNSAAGQALLQRTYRDGWRCAQF